MNNTLHEINKLQKITDTISKNVPWNLHVANALADLRDLIKEKQKEVTQFELENMSYELYEALLVGSGFNDQFY